MDAETFDEKKYVDFFAQLQQAYKNVFNRMNDEYDSTLIHGIDQSVLNESEPFYDDETEGLLSRCPRGPLRPALRDGRRRQRGPVRDRALGVRRGDRSGARTDVRV